MSQRVGVGASPIRSMREMARAMGGEFFRLEDHFRVACVKAEVSASNERRGPAVILGAYW